MTTDRPLTWDDIQPGMIIHYRHLSRARRLADRALNVRRGLVREVIPPSALRSGRIEPRD